jgi:hypothetical protein
VTPNPDHPCLAGRPALAGVLHYFGAAAGPSYCRAYRAERCLVLNPVRGLSARPPDVCRRCAAVRAEIVTGGAK